MNDERPAFWVALTGFSGFLGRHVIKSLHRHNIGVVALGRSPIAENQYLRWVPFDLSEHKSISPQALRDAKALLHLAWGGLPNYKLNRHVDEELPRHQRFLDWAIDIGIPRIAVAGTCFEYGMQEGELSESLETRPTNPYGLAKDTLRKYAESACARAGISLLWARLFYLFGEGQAPTSIWSQLAAHVERGERSFPMSGGQQVRDYLPAELAMTHFASLATHTHATGIVNVCSGEGRTLESIVRSWIAERAWTIDLELGRFPYPDHEPFRFWGSRDRLDHMLRLTLRASMHR